MTGLHQLLARAPTIFLFLAAVAASSPVFAQTLPSIVSPSTDAGSGPTVIRGERASPTPPSGMPRPDQDNRLSGPDAQREQGALPGVTNVPPSGGSGSMNFPAPGGAGTMNAPPSGGAGTMKPPPATGRPMR